MATVTIDGVAPIANLRTIGTADFPVVVLDEYFPLDYFPLDYFW